MVPKHSWSVCYKAKAEIGGVNCINSRLALSKMEKTFLVLNLHHSINRTVKVPGDFTRTMSRNSLCLVGSFSQSAISICLKVKIKV